MSGFQKLSDLAPVTMMMLGNPRKDNETDKEYVQRILDLLKKEEKCVA